MDNKYLTNLDFILFKINSKDDFYDILIIISLDLE